MLQALSQSVHRATIAGNGRQKSGRGRGKGGFDRTPPAYGPGNNYYLFRLSYAFNESTTSCGSTRKAGRKLQRRTSEFTSVNACTICKDVYFIHMEGPNHIWHLDGYDKLCPYGFAIHGCIDGYYKHILRYPQVIFSKLFMII